MWARAFNNVSEINQYVTHIIQNVIHRCQSTLFYSQSLIGDYKYSARSEDSLGWLVCDGRLLERAEHVALFEVIGTSFGSTNSSNFRLPDFRGRVPGVIGSGSGLTARSLGAIVGAERHTLTVGEMPSHNHSGTTGSAGFGTGSAGVSGIATTDVADDSGSHTHTIAAQGGDQPHNNMQPTLFGGNVLIFAGLPGSLPGAE